VRRLSLLAAALALVAACGAGPGITPATYAHQVCGAISTYEKTLTTQGAAYAAAEKAAGQNPTSLQKATGAFLEQQVTGSATLLADLQKISRPQGSGGQQIQDTFVRTARTINATLRTQQHQVEAADASNQVTFFQVLNTAQQQFTQVDQDLATALETVAAQGSQRINDAFAADQTCSSL
jgi:hypothetical protein